LGRTLYPGGGGAHTTERCLRSPPAASQRPTPFHPGITTRPGGLGLRGISKGSRRLIHNLGIRSLPRGQGAYRMVIGWVVNKPQGCSPVQPSPHLWPPRRSRRPLGFPLSFTPHGYPRRMSGRGQILSTDPSYVFDISRTSSNVTTHHVRPHVATPPPNTASTRSPCSATHSSDDPGCPHYPHPPDTTSRPTTTGSHQPTGDNAMR